MSKVRVTLSNHSYSKYDGTLWELRVRKLEHGGKKLADPRRTDTPFYEKVEELLGDDLDGPGYVRYYNDNPVAYGVPDPVVEIGGAKLDVASLVASVSEDGEKPSLVEIEIEAPPGFTL